MSALVLDVRDRLGAFELDVQCELPLKGVTALLGHSGAGKSSLLAALAGIRRPGRAMIRMGDVTLVDSNRGVFLAPERRGLGCVLQRPCLFPHMTVQGNCEYGARRRALPLVAQDVGRVMHWLDLAHLLDRRPAGLSGGEQQRVALARALLSGPKLLLLDEPLAAVDARRRNEVLPYLEQVCRDAGVPVIYVSHSIDDVARLADRIVVMHEGRVRQIGDVHAVLSRGVRDVGFDGVNVLDGVVIDADEHAPRVRVGQAELTVSMREPVAGDTARVVLRAADVHLSLSAPEQISADNALEGVVRACLDGDGESRTMVVECAGLELVADISRAAVRRLALEEGDAVYAVFGAPRARSRGAAGP